MLVEAPRKKFLMSLHTFVDESKARTFILVGATCPTAALDSVRKSLTGLLLPGQERLHFSKERDSRRRSALQVITNSPISLTVIETVKKPTEIEARTRSLRRLVREASTLSVSRMTIELDASMLALDQRIMAEMAWFGRHDFPLSYTWAQPRQEPMLWAADALAWSWAAGGHWRSQLRPVTKLIHVPLV